MGFIVTVILCEDTMIAVSDERQDTDGLCLLQGDTVRNRGMMELGTGLKRKTCSKLPGFAVLHFHIYPSDHSHFKSEQDTLDVLVFMSCVASLAFAVMVCPSA